MVNQFFSSNRLFEDGELDDLFLEMRDLLLALRSSGKPSFDDKTSKSCSFKSLEIKMFNIIYTCVYNGINPTTCKSLFDSAVAIYPNQKSSMEALRVSILSSMIIVFYNHDINELYLRASDFCSPATMAELGIHIAQSQPGYDYSNPDCMSLSAIIK